MEQLKPPKAKKAEKPNYQDFLNRLHVIMASLDGKRDPTSETHRHIKNGFQGKIENDQIEELCKYFYLWEHFPKLAIKIAIDVSTRKSSVLIAKLFNNIKVEMAARSQFPKDRIPLFTNVRDTERYRILKEWIRSSQKEGILDFAWAQKAIICLLGEHMTEDDFLLIHSILEAYCGKEKGHIPKKKALSDGSGKGNKYEAYVRLVVPLFLAGKTAKSKASFGLDMSRIFIEKVKQLEIEVIDLKNDHTSLKLDLQDCRNLVNEKESNLSLLMERISVLQKEVQSQEGSLKEEAERYELLDKHWQEKCGHELARQSFSFKRYFAFEIREAILSLDTDHPDIAMALNRIRHMEEYLQQMEPTYEQK